MRKNEVDDVIKKMSMKDGEANVKKRKNPIISQRK